MRDKKTRRRREEGLPKGLKVEVEVEAGDSRAKLNKRMTDLWRRRRRRRRMYRLPHAMACQIRR